jgi:cytochrome oxidase Cu insertion factor (SCO1/SenC/PrrC family)/thiol-disulfide isomerase/thioredoxin
MSGMQVTKPQQRTLIWIVIAAALIAGISIGAILTGGSSSSPAGAALAANPDLDPGTPLSKPAPNFTLTDQFGRQVSLSSFRGKVVILAFNDSHCTTVCPLTTTAMVDAKRYLGAAGDRVQLLGIDANPQATAVSDVRAYSRDHGMLYQWRFLTGSPPQLKRVWHAYGIDVEIQHGLIDHTPALYVIDPAGTLRRLYETQMNYSSVPQLGQLLAHEASSLLPGHPAVRSSLSYAQVSPIGPRTPVSLPRAGGGTVRLGPGRAPHLYLFFTTWDAEVFPDLKRQLQVLNGYRGQAALTAVDEGSVEPSAAALPRFLYGLRLNYPVATDQTGRIADGYEVQDLPWFVLTSGSGQFLWYYDVSTLGWLSPSSLAAHVRAAFVHAAKTAPTAAAAAAALSGSPAPLAALHRQAGQLLGPETALSARLRGLRGYPTVINAWASWCPPCQKEFPLFATASVQYGRRVAFLGADTNDTPGDAQAFLAKHPVSYPSYQDTSQQLSSLAAIGYLPTTIFINRSGKVVYVHTGQYDSLGTLEEDIGTYALGG